MIARAVKHKMNMQRASDSSTEVARLNAIIDQLHRNVASLQSKCADLEVRLSASSPSASSHVPCDLLPVDPVIPVPAYCAVSLACPSGLPLPLIDSPLVSVSSSPLDVVPVSVPPVSSVPPPAAAPCSPVFKYNSIPLLDVFNAGINVAVGLLEVSVNSAPCFSKELFENFKPRHPLRDDKTCSVSFPFRSLCHLRTIIERFQKVTLCNHRLKFCFNGHGWSYFVVSDCDDDFIMQYYWNSSFIVRALQN